MTAAFAIPMTEVQLPRLGGGLLWSYRILWGLLAAAALTVLVLSPFDAGMHPVIVALRLVKGVTIVAVAAILLRRRQSDPVAALLSLAFLSWTITSSFDFASQAIVPLLLDRARFLLFTLALLLFPDGKWRPGWTRKIAAASAAVFLIGVAETVQLLPTSLFLPLAIPCVLAAVASLVSRFRTAQTEALRQQLRWVALGLVSGIGLILSARAGSALFAVSDRFAQLSLLWEAMFQLGIVAIALGFLVSLLRYRLYDAEAVISRSAVYAVLTISLLTCFAASEGLIEVLGQRYLDSGIGDFSAAFAAAIAAVLLAPLHSRIDRWAEHRFQRDLVLLKRELPELVADLSACASKRELAAAALPHIEQAVHATRSALLLDGEVLATRGIEIASVQRWATGLCDNGAAVLECDSSDMLFPVRVPLHCSFSSSKGWLLLGARPDGTIYGRDERDALRFVVPALRHGLTSTSAREAIQSANIRALRTVRRHIDRLRKRVSALEADAPGADSGVDGW